MEGSLGRPTIVGNSDLGQGSSDKPALVNAVPGSMMIDSTDIKDLKNKFYLKYFFEVINRKFVLFNWLRNIMVISKSLNKSIIFKGPK